MASKYALVLNGNSIEELQSGDTLYGTLPDQTGHAGEFLTTDGTTASWTANAGGDVVGPASATDNALARYDGTTGKLIQNGNITQDDNGNLANVNAISFDTTPGTLPTADGSLYWDSAEGIATLNLLMAGGNVIQQIGEETYFRVKASSAITNGQVVMFTGTVGASGGLTGAPATGLTSDTASYVMGVATEDIALNEWGYVTAFGLVRGVDTSAFSDGQILFLDPTTAGGLTTTLPTAPAPKVQVCAVVYAAANGSLFVRPSFGGNLGKYEGDVQITSPANGNTLIYDAVQGRWENANLTDGTGISITEGAGSITVTNTGVTSAVAGTGISVSGATGAVTITNTAPDQTVAIASGTGISATGTYPNFTVTNTDLGSSQAIFKNVAVSGQSTIVADSNNDTLTVAAGTGISITTDAGTDTLTISSTGGGTVTSVSGTGTVSGISLSGTVTSSGSLTLGGNLTIAADMIYDQFTATASQTTFTTSTTYTSGKIDVYANGIKMVNGADVTVTSGTSVVFATGVASGTRVDLVYPV